MKKCPVCGQEQEVVRNPNPGSSETMIEGHLTLKPGNKRRSLCVGSYWPLYPVDPR